MTLVENLITLTVNGKEVRFKKPDRKVVSLAMTKAGKDVLEATEVLIENCYVDGDLTKRDLIDNVGYLLGVSQKINDIIGVAEVELKKT